MRDGLSVERVASYESKHMSSIRLLLHQPNQPPLIFAIIYHPPGLAKKYCEETIEHIITTVAKLLQKHRNAKLFISGDFNDLEVSPLLLLLPVEQLVNFSTRGERKLDLVFTDVAEYGI